MKLTSLLWKSNVSKSKLQEVLKVSERTFYRWENNPPEWVLNVINEIASSRTIPKIESWDNFRFKNDKLLLPDNSFLTANDIKSLRFDQMNRTIMRENASDICLMKNHLEKKIQALNSSITINLENSGKVVKTWKVSI